MVPSSFVRTICVFTVVLTRIFHAEAFIEATIDEVTTSTIAFTWHGGGEVTISSSDGQTYLSPVATLLPEVETESGERNITLEVKGKRYEFTNLTDGTQFDLILSDAKGLQRRLIFASTARCPLGWKGFRNSCYITESTNFTGQEGASQGCKSLLPSAHLADPRTVEEYKFITSPRVLPNSNRIYWIGITVESTDKAVYTDKSGIAEEVKEFRIGEHSEQPFMKCVTLNPGHPMKWTQTQCIAQAYHVCEYPVPQPPTGVNVKFTSPTSTEINWIEPASLYGSVFSTYSIKTRSGSPNGNLSYSKTVTKDAGELHVVTELDDGHLYHVTVTADDENGGSSAVEGSVGFVTAPFPPLDLVYSQSFNSVELNWKKDRKAIGSDYNYVIEYDGGNGTHVVRTDQLHYELVDLKPYTEYNITVYSVVFHQLRESLRETMSTPGESAAVTLRTDVSPVFDFHVVDGTLHETGFSLAWKPALGRADQYYIEITAQSVESEIKTFEVAGSRTSYEITELESGETYTVSIVTKIDKEKSETVLLEQTTRPPPPQKVFNQPQTVDSAIFAISPPVTHQPAIFEGYRFVFQNVRMPGEIVRDFDKDSSDFVVQGLNPGSDYNVKIYTKSRNVLSFPPLNNTLSLAVSAPTDFRQTSRNETAILMGWTPSQGEVTGYLVTCKNCFNNAEMLGIEDGNKILFGKLQPGKKYSFGIQARNDIRKNGLQSETIEYTTRTMPNAPIPTVMADFNKTAATVSWSSVGGTKEGYVIEYSAVAGQMSTTPLKNETVYVKDLDGQEMTAALYNLVPGISYNGSVRTVVDDTYSSLAPIHFSTEPNSVEGVEVVDVGEYWCQIRWTPGVGGYKSFTLDIKDVDTVEGITDTEYNATLLKPATSYYFEVTTVSFNSRISSTVKQGVQTRPLKVSELDVYEIKEDSFTVRWNPPRSIYDGFLIVLSGEDMEDTERVTEMTYASFNDVKPGTSYSLMVFSTYKETRSYYETQNVTLYPRTPLALISTGTTSMSLAVSWEEPQGRVGSYFVTWRPTNDGKQSEINVMKKSAVLSELTPGVSYNIQVYSRSEDDLKMSKTAANIILTTDEDFPGVPTSVIVDSTDTTSLHVGWGETTTPNGIVLWHVVRYRQIYPHPEPEFAFENVSTPSTDTIASDLESGAWYAISVRAYNSKGGGNWTEPLFKRTLQSQPGPVANLQAEAKGLRSLTISWDVPQSPNGDIQSYSLLIQDQTGEEVAFVLFSRNPKVGPLSCFFEDDPVAFNILADFIPSNKTVEMPLFESLCPISHRVDDLLPYKDYLVSVQAHTDAGTGESASTIGATLEEKPSGPPRNITVKQVGPSSITLQWDPPEHPNGRLTYYAHLYGEGEESRLDTNETSIIIPDLMPFSKYAVVMSCGTKAGRSNDTNNFLLLNTTEDKNCRSSKGFEWSSHELKVRLSYLENN